MIAFLHVIWIHLCDCRQFHLDKYFGSQLRQEDGTAFLRPWQLHNRVFRFGFFQKYGYNLLLECYAVIGLASCLPVLAFGINYLVC